MLTRSKPASYCLPSRRCEACEAIRRIREFSLRAIAIRVEPIHYSASSYESLLYEQQSLFDTDRHVQL